MITPPPYELSVTARDALLALLGRLVEVALMVRMQAVLPTTAVNEPVERVPIAQNNVWSISSTPVMKLVSQTTGTTQFEISSK
jgi:hypothetical protein